MNKRGEEGGFMQSMLGKIIFVLFVFLILLYIIIVYIAPKLTVNELFG